MASVLCLFTATASLFALVAGSPAPRLPVLQPRRTSERPNVTFDDISPSTKLTWSPCYEEGFECSYLTVPLDYQDGKAGTTDVAFIRYFVSEDAEDLLYNPGKTG